MVVTWNETTFPSLLSKYDLKDIFNAEEFGLFYQCLPNKTYHFKGQKCSGGKINKVRLTGMAAGNAIGEKLPMFVIGKPKTPCCFKRIKKLPCKYKWQRKRVGWTVKHLKNGCTNLVFLPPNTTSILQPMDQGVITSLKAHYWGRVIHRLCRALDKTKTLPKVSILQAMKILVSSWKAVSAQTIANCFRKASITSEAQNATITDADG